MTIALKLEGLYRHASTHAAGVVISDRPLEQLVPVYRDPRSDMPVTQFSLYWVEKAGLVKFDFLGLKTLTVIERACRLLAARGIRVDPISLPLDDDKTYAMLGRGDSIGVFQFESSGMRDLLRQAEPSTFEDLIALVALFRPGPMENIPKYLASKHGREDPEILHEMLQPIVKETYGVIIYQEQVMQIAQVLSGFSLGEADVLRRAMGKKNRQEMKRQRQRFIEGAVENGVDDAQAAYIFEMVDKFAGYGFNKSHSAGYALLAYQTAYLKANHPVEFYAASMSLDKGNTDKLHIFQQDAALHDITLLPPDINQSQSDFSTDDGKIVYALSAIKNVGAQAMEEIVSIREADGPFKDLFDFARRVTPHSINKRALENLVRAGAFDTLIHNRAQVFEAVPLILSHATQAAQDRLSHQQSLFGEDSIDLATPSLPLVTDWLPVDKLNREMEAIGFFLSGHPLDDYQQALHRRQVVTYEVLSKSTVHQARIVNLAGIVVRRQNRRSQKSDTPYAFLTLSDPSGSFEMLVFSDLLASHGTLLQAGAAVVITAAAEWDDDELKLVAKAVRPLEEVVADALKGLRLFIHETEAIGALHGILEQPAPAASGGKTRTGRINLVLISQVDDLSESVFREVEVELPGRFPMGAALRGALKALPGVADIQDM